MTETAVKGPAVRSELIRLPVARGHQIQLQRLPAQGVARAQWLILPGAGQDSHSWLQGPAPLPQQLAAEGLEVYLGDTRGKGGSLPRVGPKADWGVHTAVVEEIPLLLQAMRSRGEGLPWFVLAESTAGLWLLAALARQPALADSGLAGILLLQAARPQPPSAYWRWLRGPGCWRVALDGHVRAGWLSGGPAGESRQRFMESLEWWLAADWQDPEDAFDYAAAVQALALPPILHLAASDDRRLPLPAVRAFVHALPLHDARLLPTSRARLSAWRHGATDATAADPTLMAALRDWLRDCLQRHRPAGTGLPHQKHPL